MRPDLTIPAKLSPGDPVAVVSPSFAAPGRFPGVHEVAMRRLNASVAHCASFPSRVLERSSLGGLYLDTQAAAASAADVHGGEFAALDLMQDGLPGDAEGGGCLPQW